ncbi:hypothetical protein Sste5346_007751 [Sporothrix stenoceras]|uniref:Uncharacterized protein n=1 Tax=Sporothrix stenoceras TaxID=5173 RepID=A0ABR3YSG6_9PEZI
MSSRSNSTSSSYENWRDNKLVYCITVKETERAEDNIVKKPTANPICSPFAYFRQRREARREAKCVIMLEAKRAAEPAAKAAANAERETKRTEGVKTICASLLRAKNILLDSADATEKSSTMLNSMLEALSTLHKYDVDAANALIPVPTHNSDRDRLVAETCRRDNCRNKKVIEALNAAVRWASMVSQNAGGMVDDALARGLLDAPGDDSRKKECEADHMSKSPSAEQVSQCMKELVEAYKTIWGLLQKSSDDASDDASTADLTADQEENLKVVVTAMADLLKAEVNRFDGGVRKPYNGKFIEPAVGWWSMGDCSAHYSACIVEAVARYIRFSHETAEIVLNAMIGADALHLMSAGHIRCEMVRRGLQGEPVFWLLQRSSLDDLSGEYTKIRANAFRIVAESNKAGKEIMDVVYRLGPQVLI